MRTIYAIFVLLAVLGPASAQTALSPEIARTAAEVCDRSKDGFRLQVDGNLSAGVKSAIIRKVLGAEVDLDGDVSFESWEGVQQVLREHQLAKTINDNDCIRDLVPKFMEFELEYLKLQNQQSRIDRLMDGHSDENSACIPVLDNETFPLRPFKDMCLTNADGSRLVILTRADSRAIYYSNADGKDIACYPGEPCSFGWDGSPIFALSAQNGSPILISVR